MISEGQPIGDVSIGTLNRRTSDVIRQVESGDRVVVTNHGRPVTVMLPVEEGIDALLAHLVFGSAPGPDRTRKLTLAFSDQAAQALDALHSRRRGMLTLALRRAAVNCSGEGPLVVRTPMDLAACVGLVESGLLLTYLLMPRHDALRRLLGPDLHDRWRKRNIGRLRHGRMEMVSRLS